MWNSGATPTRFHATKTLSLNRGVRDIAQIYEEIVIHFTTDDVPIRVTVDVESDQLDKLTEDQRIALRENLRTLESSDSGLRRRELVDGLRDLVSSSGFTR